MIWFFAFTSMGVAIMMAILLFQRLLRLGWRQWFGGALLMGVLAWLSRQEARL